MQIKKEDPNAMSFFEHFRELKKRLIVSIAVWLVAVFICFTFYEYIVAFLYNPFKMLQAASGGEEFLFINSLFEGFLTRLKVSFVAGLILSLPVHIYQMVGFIFPGLKAKEKKVVRLALVVSTLLLAAGFYYGYYLIIPISVEFLTGSGFIPDNVGILLNFEQNIFYIFQFIFSFVILFQFPIILMLLLIMNIVKRKALLSASRYVIVGIFIISALLTPPDFISQVSLSLPLILLFYISILMAKIFRLGEDS